MHLGFLLTRKHTIVDLPAECMQQLQWLGDTAHYIQDVRVLTVTYTPKHPYMLTYRSTL